MVYDSWTFSLIDTPGTTVKNEASKRRTPLHARLIDHGFPSYVDQKEAR